MLLLAVSSGSVFNLSKHPAEIGVRDVLLPLNHSSRACHKYQHSTEPIDFLSKFADFVMKLRVGDFRFAHCFWK